MHRHFRIHDFAPYKESLKEVQGIDLYPDRAVLLEGTVYVDGAWRSEELESWHREYLRGHLGIGADEIRFLMPAPGQTLFDAVLADPSERGRIARELHGNRAAGIEAFVHSRGWQRFVRRLGVRNAQLRTPVTRAGRTLDDKLGLRLLARRLGIGECFPDFVYAKDRRTLRSLVSQMRDRYPDLVVLKRRDLDSGFGQLFVRPETPAAEIERYLEAFCDDRREIIVEQGVPGVDFSLQWEISRSSRDQRFMTRQIIKDGAHEGNVIGRGAGECLPSLLPIDLRRSLGYSSWLISSHFARWGSERGFVGPLGFDFMLSRDGNKVYLLEGNARTTASTYFNAVLCQLRKTERARDACLYARNAYPHPEFRNWRLVQSALESVRYEDGLGDLSMDPSTGHGVLIANPRLLCLDDPKCLLIAVGNDVDEAKKLWKAAVLRLQGAIAYHPALPVQEGSHFSH